MVVLTTSIGQLQTAREFIWWDETSITWEDSKRGYADGEHAARGL